MARAHVVGGAKLRAAITQAGARAHTLTAQALYIEAERVMAKSKKEAPVGVDGVLRGSGFVELPKTLPGKGVVVYLGYGGAAAGYAVAVHEGTKPHFPPVDALKRWAKKKLGDEGAAWAVARKIARVGTKATKYLERPMRELAPTMGERMARRIKAGLGA